MTTVDEALAAARPRFAAAALPAREAELLLGHVLDLDRAVLLSRGERALATDEQQRFERLVTRRLGGEPVAYLTGHRGFWSLDLEVGPGVLVPRPDTELVVELALACLAGRAGPAVLDLGTGSGAIALAIASERPDARIDAVDASDAALAVARRNAARLGIDNVRWLAGDWFEPVAGLRYDLIASNPPYVALDDPHLPALAAEPQSALVAGPTGLEAIERIASSATPRLEPGAMLVVEHGADQGPAVRALFEHAGLVDIRTHADLAGHERATCGMRPGSAPAGNTG